MEPIRTEDDWIDNHSHCVVKLGGCTYWELIMRKPKPGDSVRVPRYIWGSVVSMDTFVLEEFHYCLGFFESDAHRADSKFTPLCELLDKSPEAKVKYWSHYGEYTEQKIQLYENIKSE